MQGTGELNSAFYGMVHYFIYDIFNLLPGIIRDAGQFL